MTTPESAGGAVDPAVEFPIAWSDPADCEMTWEHDDMHTPFCMAPLAWDYAQLIGHGFAYAYERLDVPIAMRAEVFNGYCYFTRVQDIENDQYLLKKREATSLSPDYWRRALPELRDLYAWIAAVAVDDLSAADLAEVWEGAWERAQRAWRIHFYAILGPYQVMDDLADFYEQVVPDASPGEAMKLIQGTINELADVDAGLSRLAAIAAATPELAAAIRESPPPTVEGLAAIPGGAALTAELSRFLDVHGHLGQGFDDLGLASWAEEPWMVVSDIGRRLDQAVEPAESRVARLAAEADALAAAVRAKIADDAERLAEFDRLLALAREIGNLTELHNYWIDRMAQARLRRFAFRVGERLAREGVIDQAADILFLRRREVPDLVVAPADRRALVHERKADLERWSALKPPAAVGKPSTGEPGGRFGGERFASDDDAVLRGTGASAGVVAGPARVVLGPDDFARVEAGDIIVAPSSNPSWVPLFAIAGGLITNTGGVLSHAAVVAREFDLPAVVGTGDATSRIADGRQVELDGTTGVIRLL